MDTTKITAPKNWKTNLQWFEDVPEDTRSEYAREHCSKVYSWMGQACVIISYPRQDGKVAFYDMDGGDAHWALLSTLSLGDEFDEVLRDSEEADFEWSMISGSILSDEAMDICFKLFDDA